jgi:hypothetical protein
VGVLLVGLVVLAGFVRSELRRPDPLLPVAYLRDRGLTGSLVALFAIQFAVLATMVSLVAYLEAGVGVTAAAAGLVVAVTGMGSPLLSITTGRLADTMASVASSSLVSSRSRWAWCSPVPRRRR